MHRMQPLPLLVVDLWILLSHSLFSYFPFFLSFLFVFALSSLSLFADAVAVCCRRFLSFSLSSSSTFLFCSASFDPNALFGEFFPFCFRCSRCYFLFLLLLLLLPCPPLFLFFPPLHAFYSFILVRSLLCPSDPFAKGRLFSSTFPLLSHSSLHGYGFHSYAIRHPISPAALSLHTLILITACSRLFLHVLGKRVRRNIQRRSQPRRQIRAKIHTERCTS